MTSSTVKKNTRQYEMFVCLFKSAIYQSGPLDLPPGG
jgi:hypothetical protein